jgi:hypothetical protein
MEGQSLEGRLKTLDARPQMVNLFGRGIALQLPYEPSATSLSV